MNVLLMAMLLSSFQAPVPTPRQAPGQTAPGSQFIENNTTQDGSKPAAKPVQRSIGPVGGETKGGDAAAQNKQEPIVVSHLPEITITKDNWDKAYILFTFALVLVGAATFAVIYYQAKETARAAGATEVAAKAASEGAVALINSERAWAIIIPDGKTFPSLGPNRSSFRGEVWNSGRTVAKITFTFSHIKRIQSLSDLPPIPEYGRGSPSREILPPVPAGSTGSMGLVIACVPPLAQEDFTAISRKELLLYAYGIIRYRDSFEKDRSSAFGFLWKPQTGNPIEPGGWERAGPDAYNEAT